MLVVILAALAAVLTGVAGGVLTDPPARPAVVSVRALTEARKKRKLCPGPR